MSKLNLEKLLETMSMHLYTMGDVHHRNLTEVQRQALREIVQIWRTKIIHQME